ncbi:probably inactive leucine-rich repeat receptor-like protein kinase At5g48380 [Cucurbita moschata]|uniref:non-specific serine/threonine protein kinase n=1 Tax=Cucurbita moschata TaxID=3662 RepID=A0A6J1GQ47_CUCMO|nr:probably inactive leucine-rich repeat receptor-like protein kinase At5g48380 [Cucurbita moschata]XP_022954172.1 probably inactive leucine-rich repeat receptor-like protein kinase At5g48380 [Cucurbita moschata]
MNDMVCNRFVDCLVAGFVVVLLSSSNGFTSATETDLSCLRSIKKSLQDPNNYLLSWDFSNRSEGVICKFSGVMCWHPDENRVLSISLSDMGLKGQFPPGIKNCTSLTGLDLSNNQISGQIPTDIGTIIKFATTLDLSSNDLTGPIPESIANCSYLNVLNLDHNQLTGQIPPELGLLGRLTKFSVANNLLTGPVPQFGGNLTNKAEMYANNPGLCGGPSMNPCPSPSNRPHTSVIAGAAVGGVTVAAVGVGIGMFFYFRSASMKKRRRDDDPEGNKWARNIKGSKGIKISVIENSVPKMNLSDLMKATNNFSKSNIIGSGRTGCIYRAVFEDGSSLMVKRLQESQRSEKEFLSEMATLGSVKHANLVPLLGFCMAKKEKLLVYKDMPNGTLHDQLHPEDGDRKPMEWSLRLKIGIRAAKGLAWLHHNCNPRIIHRNISSKCILLDETFEPKISDFGLARLMNPIDTHLSTFVNGEFGDIGYVAPEYSRTLVATPKGDVYSFGVVLLELVTGERPTHVSKASEDFKGNLVEWVTKLYENSKQQEALDDTLVDKNVDSELLQFLKVAWSCVVPTAKERPTMFEVYQLLRAIGEGYNFTSDDEIAMPTNTESDAGLEELIVAR